MVDVPADAVQRTLRWTLDQEQFREDLPEPRLAALLAREWAAVAVRQDDPGDLPGLRLGLEALLSALQKHLEKLKRVDAYILAHVVAARTLLDPLMKRCPGCRAGCSGRFKEMPECCGGTFTACRLSEGGAVPAPSN